MICPTLKRLMELELKLFTEGTSNKTDARELLDDGGAWDRVLNKARTLGGPNLILLDSAFDAESGRAMR